ncbi:hypothetical protein AS19_20020 [Alcanivorax sp. NBRC 101098]|jgi:hypothetical protein|nr:hypothetical protein AS19_20020 [Alcanivorax sp. NBRC 101098]
MEARCLLCNHDLLPAVHSQVGPLWQRLGRYLRLPFSLPLLPLLAIWPVLATLLPPLWAMVPVALVAGLPTFVFSAALMTLRASPRKSRKAAFPGWDCLAESASWKSALWQALPASLVIGLAALLMVAVSVPVGLLVAVIGMLLVPALWLAVLVQGAEPGAYAAVGNYIVSAPRDYAVAAGFASLGCVSAVALVGVAVDVLPLPLVQGVAGLLAAWWWLVLAEMCGDIAARHSRLWGLNQGGRRVTLPLAERRQRAQLCAGRFDKVLLTTSKIIKTKKATVADWQHHDRLLAVLGKEDERIALAESYLDCLVGAQAWSVALELVARQRHRDSQWVPSAPALRLALAEGVYPRDPKLAVALLKELHQKYPEFADLGEAYLLLAKVLAEAFGLSGKAEQYLRYVESHCRDVRLRQKVADCRLAWG